MFSKIVVTRFKTQPDICVMRTTNVATSAIGGEPMNLFWFAHHTVLMSGLTRMPTTPCLSYGEATDLERQLCQFILRGIGLNETAIATHLDREMSRDTGQPAISESA